MREQLVLFDIDGTLLRGTGSQHKQALLEAARSVMQMDCTFDGIDTAGCLDPDLLRLLLAQAGASDDQIAGNMAALAAAAQQHYAAHCQDDFSDKLCPGVSKALAALTQAGVPLGLVTGNLSAIAWRKLANAGIAHYFSFGAFAEQANTRVSLARLAVAEAQRRQLAPAGCAVTLIGDHVNDVEAARQNGFRSVAVATGMLTVEQLQLAGADLVLDHLENASLADLCGI